MVELTIQFREVDATSVHSGFPSPPAKAIADAVQAHGMVLRPMHPGATGSQATWFVVDVPNPVQAQEMLEAIRSLDAVDAAYLKPRDELP